MHRKRMLAAALTAVIVIACCMASCAGSASNASAAASANIPKPAAMVNSAAPAAQFCSRNYMRLFDDAVTHRFTICISQSEWMGLSVDMLEYKDTDEWMRTGNYRHAGLVYEDDYGTITLDNIGIRTRGNTTRIMPEDEIGYHRAHFSLKFDETFDLVADTAAYTKLKGREFCGLDKLNLKWNLWTDISHIHELYCYELLSAAGVHAPSVSLAALDFDIDGELLHYGVYTVIEPVDKPFLTKRFGKKGNDGNLYKCLWENIPASLEAGYAEHEIGVKNWGSGYRPAYDLQTNEESWDTQSLISFIGNINNLSDEEFAAYIERNFEADKFLRYMAVNVLVGNADDYRTAGNNYYLYFNNSGKIELIPYDYDASLGGGWAGGGASSYEALATEDIYAVPNINAALVGHEVAHPLADRILAIPEYRKRYEYYLQYLIDSGLFSYDEFLHKFESLQALYGEDTYSDTTDCGETMRLTTEEWFFETKTASVLSQLAKSKA